MRDVWSRAVISDTSVYCNQIKNKNRFAAEKNGDIVFGGVATGGSGHQMTLLLHWDGASWKIAPNPNPTKGNFLDDLLFAGVIPSAGNVWIFRGEAEFSEQPRHRDAHAS
jgi:hypothetical protein